MMKLAKYLPEQKLFNLLFIASIAALLGILYLFLRRYVVSETFTFKVIDPELINTKYSFYLPIHVGDKEINDFGAVKSEVVKVESYAINPEQRDIYIDIKLKAVFNPKNKTYSYKGKNVAYGEDFVLNFPEARFSALSLGLTQILNKNTKTNMKMIRVQLREHFEEFSDTYGVPDYLANAVVAGDVMRSTNGEELVKVINVSIQPAVRVVSNFGTLRRERDPVLKDVFMILEIKTYEQDGEILMFNRIPLGIGQVIPLHIKGKISAWPTITEIL